MIEKDKISTIEHNINDLTKEKLIELYTVKELTRNQIAQMYGVKKKQD